MNRTVAGAVRVGAGALMALALLPVVVAGAAQAADPAAPQATPYADQVGIGTAVKIGNPAEVGTIAGTQAQAAVASHPATDGVDEAAAAAEATETPSDAVVLETESHQATDPTEVAVLGTKVGAEPDAKPGTLAETGPSTVTVQTLVALLLILAGVALRGASQFAVAIRRASARRH